MKDIIEYTFYLDDPPYEIEANSDDLESLAEQLVEEHHVIIAEYPDEETIFLRKQGTSEWLAYKVYAETRRHYHATFKGYHE